MKCPVCGFEDATKKAFISIPDATDNPGRGLRLKLDLYGCPACGVLLLSPQALEEHKKGRLIPRKGKL